MWSQFKQLMFTVDDPNKLFFQYKYIENYESCIFRAEKTKTANAKHTNQKRYKKPIGIVAKKKDGLATLCQKFHILKHHHVFYEALTICHNGDDDDQKNAVSKVSL